MFRPFIFAHIRGGERGAGGVFVLQLPSLIFVWLGNTELLATSDV